MKLYRFVVGPEKLSVSYEPQKTFGRRVAAACAGFWERHDLWPDTCYVSVLYFGPLPHRVALEGAESVRFRRQTLLGMDEILLGVEVEMDLWEEGDNEFSERAIG